MDEADASWQSPISQYRKMINSTVMVAQKGAYRIHHDALFLSDFLLVLGEGFSLHLFHVHLVELATEKGQGGPPDTVELVW